MTDNGAGNAARTQGPKRTSKSGGSRRDAQAAADTSAADRPSRRAYAQAAAEAAAKAAEEPPPRHGRARSRSGAEDTSNSEDGAGGQQRNGDAPVSPNRDDPTERRAVSRAQDAAVQDLIRASKTIALVPEPPADAPEEFKELLAAFRAEHAQLASDARRSSEAVSRLKAALIVADSDIDRTKRALLKVNDDDERSELERKLVAFSCDKSEVEAALQTFRLPREENVAQCTLVRELAVHAINLYKAGATYDDILAAVDAKRNPRAGVTNTSPARTVSHDARDPGKERVAQLNIIAKLPSQLSLEPMLVESSIAARERLWNEMGVKQEYWAVALDQAIPSDKRSEVNGLSATINGVTTGWDTLTYPQRVAALTAKYDDWTARHTARDEWSRLTYNWRAESPRDFFDKLDVFGRRVEGGSSVPTRREKFYNCMPDFVKCELDRRDNFWDDPLPVRVNHASAVWRTHLQQNGIPLPVSSPSDPSAASSLSTSAKGSAAQVPDLSSLPRRKAMREEKNQERVQAAKEALKADDSKAAYAQLHAIYGQSLPAAPQGGGKGNGKRKHPAIGEPASNPKPGLPYAPHNNWECNRCGAIVTTGERYADHHSSAECRDNRRPGNGRNRDRQRDRRDRAPTPAPAPAPVFAVQAAPMYTVPQPVAPQLAAVQTTAPPTAWHTTYQMPAAAAPAPAPAPAPAAAPTAAAAAVLQPWPDMNAAFAAFLAQHAAGTNNNNE